jgi:hypothetical protein
MPSPHAHVSLVTLGVRDVASVARFYEHMGFVRKLRAAGDDVAFFEAGASRWRSTISQRLRMTPVLRP